MKKFGKFVRKNNKYYDIAESSKQSNNIKSFTMSASKIIGKLILKS